MTVAARLAAAKLDEHADALVAHWPALLAAPDHATAQIILKELGVGKVGHRAKAFVLLVEERAATTASALPAEEAAHTYQVVHHPLVYVRASPSVASAARGVLRRGAFLRAAGSEREGGFWSACWRHAYRQRS